MTLSLLLAAALAGPVPSGVFWDAGFARNPLWSDGKAEISIYDERDLKDGVPRGSRAALIVVAEDLDRSKLVKADRPAGEPKTLRVLKLNDVRSVRTGVFIYEQMLSVFLGAGGLTPVKLTVSSHDWCGNSFAEWRSDRRLLSLRSYFESVADQDLPLEPGEAIFYDALALKLRSLDFARTREGRIGVIDTLFSNNPSPPGVRKASLRVARSGETYRVEVLRGGDRDLFEFEAAYPHRLTRWERADGGRLTLLDSRRFRYWERNRPGDENLLPVSVAR